MEFAQVNNLDFNVLRACEKGVPTIDSAQIDKFGKNEELIIQAV